MGIHSHAAPGIAADGGVDLRKGIGHGSFSFLLQRLTCSRKTPERPPGWRRIAANLGKSRIVLLSGPSGSGKTTTAKKIEAKLEEMGIRSHAVAMDNYFKTVDPETAPRNREGQIDYESPFCMDMDLLNRHFAALDRGEKILIPKFEFARQMRSDIKSQPLRLGRDEIAIFEGIHARERYTASPPGGRWPTFSPSRPPSRRGTCCPGGGPAAGGGVSPLRDIGRELCGPRFPDPGVHRRRHL